MRFDRKIFFDQTREWLGPLSRQQVNGLNFLLDGIENDPHVTRIEWAAYMLATTKHETAHTFQPIHEYGSRNYFIKRYGSQTKVGKMLGNDTPEEGAIYSGEGDVQLTGESNFEKAEDALREEYPELIADFEKRTGRKFDLTVGDQPDDIDDPKNAGDPAIAYAIMSHGMRTGMFTGKSLKTYTTSKGFEPVKARQIINRLDKAQLIAGYYKHFLDILKASLISAGSSEEKVALSPAVAESSQTDISVSESSLSSTDQPTVSETVTKDTVSTSGGSASSESRESTFQASTITQTLPKMKRAYQYLGTGAFATVASTMYGLIDNMEPWKVLMLGFLCCMFITALAVIAWFNRKWLFETFKEVAHINADPTTNNIDLQHE